MKVIFKQPIYKRIYNLNSDYRYSYDDKLIEERVLLENNSGTYSIDEEIYIEDKKYKITKRQKLISSKEEAIVYLVNSEIIQDGESLLQINYKKSDKISNLEREVEKLEFKLNKLQNHWLVKLFRLAK